MLSADPKKSAGVSFIANLKNCASVNDVEKWLKNRFFGLFGQFFYTRARACIYALVILLSLLVLSPGLAEAASGSSASYRLDYGRVTSDSDHKTSSSYVLLDSISDISVEGDSASYQLRNVYAGTAAAVAPAVCGNNVIETGESCEYNNFQGLTCQSFGFQQGALQCVNCQIVTTQCITPGGGGPNFFCGNGIREAGEQCDDGNIFSGDGCSAGCRVEEAVCGNGIKDLGEQCDDGNVSTGDGCTPMCLLEGEEPEEPETPKPPIFVFQPGYDPNLIFPTLEPETETPVRPSAPELVPPTRPVAPEYYDYHFDHFRVGDIVTVLDETVFIVTAAPANQLYELVILDDEGRVVVRQGIKSSKNGILMVESLPFLEYRHYTALILDTQHEVFKGWKILIEDHEYREHDNLLANGEANREYINLGTFRNLETIGGKGEPRTNYYAYLQKVKRVKNEIPEIIFSKVTAGSEGDYEIQLPEKLDQGSYLLQVVQVHEDGKVSRNKRYIFDIQSGKKIPPIWVLIVIAMATVWGRLEDLKRYLKKKINQPSGWQIRALVMFMSLVTLSTAVIPAGAVTTTPGVFVYEGKLLDSTSTPITTPQTFRLSLWSTDDLVAGDITGGGAINTLAPAYSGWFETHTVTPNTDGTFFLELGSSTPLPDMDFSIHKNLMVEIKTAGALDTSYELMDPTGDAGADIDDRQTIGSTPYTNNADFLDNAEIGTSAGDLAVLDVGGVWNINTIPGGTNADTFTLDYDDTVVVGNISLQFGSTLAESLLFDVTNDWFEFSNDVNLNQNQLKNFAIDNLAAAPGAPVTGQIYYNTTDGNTYIWNGVSWEDITEVADDDLDSVYLNDTDKEMDVLDVRGITFNLDTSGDFLVDLQDTGDFRIADDGTEFAIFTDDGLFGIGNLTPASVLHADSNAANTTAIVTVENTGGDFQLFRTDASPEAVVTASIGDLAVDSSNGNAYIKNTGIGTSTGWIQFGGQTGKQAVFQVEYPNATVEGDGTDNKGLLQSYFVDDGGSDKYNYLEWTTNKATMQDVDVILSYILPPDFVSFTTTPLSILYQTSDAVLTTNRLDMALYDTTGTLVPLTGGSALASGSWSVANITFGGAPTFTAGDAITLVIRLSATGAGYARVSDVLFNYNGT